MSEHVNSSLNKLVSDSLSKLVSSVAKEIKLSSDIDHVESDRFEKKDVSGRDAIVRAIMEASWSIHDAVSGMKSDIYSNTDPQYLMPAEIVDAINTVISCGKSCVDVANEAINTVKSFSGTK